MAIGYFEVKIANIKTTEKLLTFMIIAAVKKKNHKIVFTINIISNNVALIIF